MLERLLVLGCQSFLTEHPTQCQQKAPGIHRTLLRKRGINSRIFDQLFRPIACTGGDKLNWAALSGLLNIQTRLSVAANQSAGTSRRDNSPAIDKSELICPACAVQANKIAPSPEAASTRAAANASAISVIPQSAFIISFFPSRSFR
jgi:hypothetical protein